MIQGKNCTHCNEWLVIERYSAEKRASDGKRAICKSCASNIEKKRRSEWTGAHKFERNRRAKEWLENNVILARSIRLYNSALMRSKKIGKVCSLSKPRLREILDAGVCQRSGLPFKYNMDNTFWRNPFSPSIDRIDNSIGYRDENVQVVCNMYNSGKAEADELDFIAMCIAVAENNKDNHAAVQRLQELRENK